ncbi:MAG: cell division protein FtsA [Anaerolineae bacterium]|nr:cell division protein FtsA [Anaerolineae bacterium]
MDRIIVGIDVGSSKVCTLVGEITDEGQSRIVGVGIAPSAGLRKGVVVNVAQATGAITASVEAAEQTSGYQIQRAYVSLSGTHISSLNSRGVVGISRRERGITFEDVERVLDAARAVAVPHNQEVIHVVPRGYLVDGQGGVRDPIGMHGFRLEVEAHIVTGSSTSIQNLLQCVEGAGVGVDQFVVAGIAAGEAILTETEREMGVVLADIGAGTTDIAIFIDGTVWHTITLGVGGEYVTSDIAIGLRLPPQIAESIKIESGCARASQVSPEERFTVANPDAGAAHSLPRWKLAEIMEARLEEILIMVHQEIKRSGYDGLLPTGIVLCGGTAGTPGIGALGEELLGLPVRVGKPVGIGGLSDKVANPAQAVGLGLLRWGRRIDAQPRLRRIDSSNGQRLLKWLRALLPG